jgi:hypothetical protein
MSASMRCTPRCASGAPAASWPSSQAPARWRDCELLDRGIDCIDVLKIDMEGAGDVALVPFLAQAMEALWKRDLKGAFAARGYRLLARSRLNSVYRR